MLQSCDQVEHIVEEGLETNKEIATDIELYYSDSAITQFKIISPRRESYVQDKKLIEEYPLGLNVEFYDKEQNVISSMKAPYAKRISVDGIMIMKNAKEENVILVNGEGDKLTTTGIEWNEIENTLKTNKFVQLVKMSTRDTSYDI